MNPAGLETRLRAALARPAASSSDHEIDGPFGPVQIDPATLRPAAVLLGVDVTRENPRVLLTRRAAHLRHHAGQAALPGGKIEPGETAAEAALREAAEEVALPNARVLGSYGPHETITAFAVEIVVGLIETPWTPVPEAGEVEEAFFLPFDLVADLSAYRIESRVWGGQRRHFHVLPHGPHYVWGATARMLRALAERLA